VTALNAVSAGRAVAYWRRLKSEITGICAYNDEVALAVLAGMRAQGLNAPGDFAVIGVDDIPAGALTSPALTTVATGMSELGKYLAISVINVLEGAAPPPGPGPEAIQVISRDTV